MATSAEPNKPTSQPAARFWFAAVYVLGADAFLAERGVSLVHRLIPLTIFVALVLAGFGAYLERKQDVTSRKPAAH